MNFLKLENDVENFTQLKKDEVKISYIFLVCSILRNFIFLFPKIFFYSPKSLTIPKESDYFRIFWHHYLLGKIREFSYFIK